jgi:hypothetical protein
MGVEVEVGTGEKEMNGLVVLDVVDPIVDQITSVLGVIVNGS